VIRRLSYSEIDTALSCWAKWDFSYGGRLAGDSLKPKEIAPILSNGRAWGAAVAAWHEHGGELLAGWYAQEALRESLAADESLMRAAGVPMVLEARLEAEERLTALLEHYMQTSVPLPNLTRVEGEINVPIPSRGGRRGSNAYRFQCFLDGYTSEDGKQWVVEFKLRNQLQPVPLIERSRQIRWYAWALARSQEGTDPVGVIVDERLNEVPKPARVLKGGKPSHAKDQMTTPERYAELCAEFGEVPKDDVIEALGARLWQQRVPLPFRRGEIDVAGQELVSAARLVRDLDSGLLTPIRNAKRQTCNGCRFERVCSEPGDRLYVDMLFDRVAPKRLRGEPTDTTDTTEKEAADGALVH
jgi:hypothetical protein